MLQRRKQTKQKRLEMIQLGIQDLLTIEKDLFMSEWSEEAMESVRWANVGYHFQWTLRKYLVHKKGTFPVELAELCESLACQVGYQFTAEGKAKPLGSSIVEQRVMGYH